jgi:hypothetical protein
VVRKIFQSQNARAAAGFAALAVLLLLSCSEAPVVPVQPTNRRVLAELVGETG